jgi:hypothetical protein
VARYPLQWADYELPRREAAKHFLVAGASGSGKSTLLRGLLWSILRSSEPLRALVYDAKTDDAPYLYGMLGVTEEQARQGTSRVRLLHPFDVRGSAWDLPRDLNGPLAARQFSAIMLPSGANGKSGEAENFFLDAVRDLHTGVILTLKNCTPNPDSFEYRDVLLALTYEPYLRFILSLTKTRDQHPFPITQRLKRSYLEGDERTTRNIFSTINAKLSGYEAVAACWARSVREGRKPFSLSRWAEDDCQEILVLGNDEASRAVIDPLNQAIFKRAVEVSLARREATAQERDRGENQTWFLLDEIREAGFLDGLGRLLTKGRSKNCCIALGFQAIEGLSAVYGDDVAHELCGQCSHLAVLRLNSGKTANWAVELFGRRLASELSSTRGTDTEGKVNNSTQAGLGDRTWLYTSDFMYLPEAGPEHGIWGFVRTPQVDPERHDLWMNLAWSYVQSLLPPSAPHTGWRAPFIRRPVEDEYLQPWDAADWQRLGFPGEPPDWADGPAPDSPGPDGPAPAQAEPDNSPPPRAFPGLRPISVAEF